MNFDLILLKGFLSFVLLVIGSFFLQRIQWKYKKRRGKRCLGFYPSSASMGNALQNLQSLVQPQVEHILEEKLDEEADEDQSGGPKDPDAHLRRQAERIRKGKKVERITVLLQKGPENDGKSD